METHPTTIGVVKNKGKILLLKRTSDRKSSPNLWQTVSGFIKEFEPAEEAIIREVKEETGLEGEIDEKGEVFEVKDNWGRWIIIPFLVSVESRQVELDSEEHSDYKWIEPWETEKFDCVEGTKKDLKEVRVL